MNNWLNFSIGPGSDPHWLSCFKLLHYYHLLLCSTNAVWDIEKTNEMKCLLHFLLLVVLRSNNRLQIFFKTVVLKYFAIFTGKHLCWSRYLIKFQCLHFYLKRDSNTGVFMLKLQREASILNLNNLVSNFCKYIYSSNSHPEGFRWKGVACNFTKKRLWRRWILQNF